MTALKQHRVCVTALVPRYTGLVVSIQDGQDWRKSFKLESLGDDSVGKAFAICLSENLSLTSSIHIENWAW